MEYWKGRIADGNLSAYELGGDLDGDEIFLVGGSGQKNSIEARLYYSLQRLEGYNPYGSTDLTEIRAKMLDKMGRQVHIPHWNICW